jgi:hypothetical protein
MPAFYSLVFGNRTTPLINDIRSSDFGRSSALCRTAKVVLRFRCHSHTHSNTNSVDGKAGMSIIILLPSCNLSCMILVSIWYNAATGVSLYLLSSNVIVKQSNEVNVYGV